MTTKPSDHSLFLKIMGLEIKIREIRDLVQKNREIANKKQHTEIDVFGQTLLRFSDVLTGLERSVMDYSRHMERPSLALPVQKNAFQSMDDLHRYVDTLSEKADALLERVREDQSILRVARFLRRKKNAITIPGQSLPAITRQRGRRNANVFLPDGS